MPETNKSTLTREAIIAYYGGDEDFNPEILCKFGTKNEQIKSRYSKMEFYKNLPIHDKININVSSLDVSFENIKTNTVCATIIGAMVGVIFDKFANELFNMEMSYWDGAFYGSLTGALTGVSYTLVTGVSKNNRFFRHQLTLHPSYENFKLEMTQNQYSLFMAFLKNYAEKFTETEANQIYSFMCPITLDIPLFPVFSPYDLERKTPYEKEAIEKHIFEVENKIKRAQQSGSTEQYIDSIRKTTCPKRGKPFKACDLVYDVTFSRSVIKFLSKVHVDMLSRVQDGEDQIQEEALRKLIHVYRSHYTQFTDAAIDNIKEDFIKLGLPFKRAQIMGNELKETLQEI